MYKKIILIGLVLILFSSVAFSLITNSQDIIDKEIQNTIKDNELAQSGATTGYSFPTNYGKETFRYECQQCVCECDN